jgi:hypothetical protein
MSQSRTKLAIALSCLLFMAADKADDKTAADKAALQPLQSYVGGWRGVGQPQRGSTKGAWTEQADWAWHFADARATLEFKAPEAKYFSAGTIRATGKDGQFELVATRADKSEDRFSGSLGDDGKLVFTAAQDSPGNVARITLRQVAGGDRLVVLLEKRLASGDRFERVAEVGYTRVGAEFAKGTNGPECVVTGGVGTIAVQYEGKTYFVCCTGCRDLFNEDPKAVLAEYRERKAKGKK